VPGLDESPRLNQPKRRPQKPDRPLASIRFSPTGKVKLSVEQLPRTQDELELAIGRKFAGALAHFHARHLADLAKAGEPGDLMCRENSRIVTIQLVEVVDPIAQRLHEIREEYCTALREQSDDVLALFNGCSVSLLDKGHTPFLPRPHGRLGRRHLSALAGKLRELGQEVKGRGPGFRFVYGWGIGPSRVPVHVICEYPAAAPTPCRLSWKGGRSYVPGEELLFLTKQVRAKVRKRYARPAGPFWLVAYSSDTLLAEEAPDVREARKVLSSTAHPFDEAWYIYPYENKDVGHLVRLWPADAQALHPGKDPPSGNLLAAFGPLDAM
jgi:hypothetical protein